MIVKAISHTSTHKSSIKKLIEYVLNPDKMQDIEQKREQLVLKQFVQGYHSDKWVNAFKENDNNRTFRHAKRTVLRHEIISFSPKSNQYLTRDVLKTIAKYYLKHRSPKSLGICTVHYDKAPHIHFIISGVGIGGVSTRISREEFKAFKIKLQEFQQQLFPELSHSIVNHSKKKSLVLKLTQKEQHMKIRGVVSEKEQLSRKVVQIANTCKSLEELSQRLEENLITPYSRNGKLIGLWFGNKKFRFTTLGVGKQHLKQLTKEQERLDSLALLKSKQSKNRGLER